MKDDSLYRLLTGAWVPREHVVQDLVRRGIASRLDAAIAVQAALELGLFVRDELADEIHWPIEAEGVDWEAR